MRIAIFGVGGVGGYFGGQLARSGEQVFFIARGEHLKAMQKDGLRVESFLGDVHVQPVQASDDPAHFGEVEIVLLAVKAWQVPEAARTMKPLIGPKTGVIYLGNGVEAPSQLAAEIGEQHVIGGLCHISAFIAAPGVIRHAGLQPDVVFGELDGSPSERTERLLLAFRKAGVTAKVPADIQAAIWEKFVFIAALSGVGAVARLPAGIWRQVPETRRLIESALVEIEALARLRGVRLAEDIVASTMAFIDNLAPTVTASMQRDIMDGKPSELEAQNGAVVRLAAGLGLPTPVNQFIYASLLPQELKARGVI